MCLVPKLISLVAQLNCHLSFDSHLRQRHYLQTIRKMICNNASLYSTRHGYYRKFGVYCSSVFLDTWFPSVTPIGEIAPVLAHMLVYTLGCHKPHSAPRHLTRQRIQITSKLLIYSSTPQSRKHNLHAESCVRGQIAISAKQTHRSNANCKKRDCDQTDTRHREIHIMLLAPNDSALAAIELMRKW